MPSRRKGRKSRRRRRRRGGQGVESMIHTALLPATLYYLQKQQARRTRRRNRGLLGNALVDTVSAGGNILGQATDLVKNAVKPLTKGLKGGRSRRHRRGGQGVQSLVHRALLPGTLYYLQKQQQHKGRRRRGRKYRKGSPSKTRPGRKDFITHLGSNVYDRLGHFLTLRKKPYTRRRRRRRGGRRRRRR